jgi:hypothetical protein
MNKMNLLDTNNWYVLLSIGIFKLVFLSFLFVNVHCRFLVCNSLLLINIFLSQYFKFLVC